MKQFNSIIRLFNHLHASGNGVLIILADIAGRIICDSSLNPDFSIILKPNIMLNSCFKLKKMDGKTNYSAITRHKSEFPIFSHFENNLLTLIEFQRKFPYSFRLNLPNQGLSVYKVFPCRNIQERPHFWCCSPFF